MTTSSALARFRGIRDASAIMGLLDNLDVQPVTDAAIGGLFRRLEPADEGLTVGVSVVSPEGLTEKTCSAEGARWVRSDATPTITISFERLEDLIRVETGELLFPSVLAASRAEIKAERHDARDKIHAQLNDVAGSDDGRLRDLWSFFAWAEEASDDDILGRLDARLAYACVRYITRTMSEALELTDLLREVETLRLEYRVEHQSGQISGFVIAEEESYTFAMSGSSNVDLLMLWKSPAGFVRWLGHQIDQETGYMTGRFDIQGDLSLLPALLTRVSMRRIVGLRRP